MMLDITYSHLVPVHGTEARLDFTEAGGSKTIGVDSYQLPVRYETDEKGEVVTKTVIINGYNVPIPIIAEIVDNVVMFKDVPEWLKIEITDVDNDFPNREITYLTFTVEPSSAPRWAEPIVYSLGAEQKFIVTQGDVTSIGENKVSEVKVTKTGDSFNVVCSTDFEAVAIYNISGQKVYEGAVQGGGATTISAAGFEKGIYIFKFAGNKTETVKVLN